MPFEKTFANKFASRSGRYPHMRATRADGAPAHTAKERTDPMDLRRETFALSLQTGNAAFTEHPASEIARILRVTAERIEEGVFDGPLVDVNGNTVGSYHLHGGDR